MHCWRYLFQFIHVCGTEMHFLNLSFHFHFLIEFIEHFTETKISFAILHLLVCMLMCMESKCKYTNLMFWSAFYKWKCMPHISYPLNAINVVKCLLTILQFYTSYMFIWRHIHTYTQHWTFCYHLFIKRIGGRGRT